MIIREMIRLRLNLETNHSVSVCATCLLTCAVQVWSTEMVDGYREGQVETCHADGLRAMKSGCEAWTEGLRCPKTDRGWLTHEDIDKRELMLRCRLCSPSQDDD